MFQTDIIQMNAFQQLSAGISYVLSLVESIVGTDQIDVVGAQFVALSDTFASLDALTGVLGARGDVSETSSLVDAETGLLTNGVSLAEVGALLEAVIVQIQVLHTDLAESGPMFDLLSAAQGMSAQITEAGTLQDVVAFTLNAFRLGNAYFVLSEYAQLWTEPDQKQSFVLVPIRQVFTLCQPTS